MYYYLSGTVTMTLPGIAVIDCGGVGYAVNTSRNTLAALKTGEKATVYTYLLVREDAMELYGFADQ